MDNKSSLHLQCTCRLTCPRRGPTAARKLRRRASQDYTASVSLLFMPTYVSDPENCTTTETQSFSPPTYMADSHGDMHMLANWLQVYSQLAHALSWKWETFPGNCSWWLSRFVGICISWSWETQTVVDGERTSFSLGGIISLLNGGQNLADVVAVALQTLRR